MVEIVSNIQPLISLVISIATLLGIIFAVYKFSKDPDIKNNEEILLIKQKCELLHGNIDDQILIIKENHLKHMEMDLKNLNKNQVRILTILDERLPRKE